MAPYFRDFSRIAGIKKELKPIPYFETEDEERAFRGSVDSTDHVVEQGQARPVPQPQLTQPAPAAEATPADSGRSRSRVPSFIVGGSAVEMQARHLVIPAEAGIHEERLMKRPCVYIMTNQRNGILYAGVTSNLAQRVWQHKNNLVEGFTKR